MAVPDDDGSWRSWGRTRVHSLLFSLSLVAPSLACRPGEAERPAENATSGFDLAPGVARNLILISIDTLRADHLGCYGYGRETSPALDALAKRGALFEQDISSSSWTVPAHMSMLTGLYPRSHGVDSGAKLLAPETITLAQHLSRLGFVTGAIVNTGLLRKHDFPRGFARYKLIAPAGKSWGASRNADSCSAPKILESAGEWMRANSRQRFFLFLHIYDVHADYSPLPEYLALFERPYSGPANGTTTQLQEYMLRPPGGEEWGSQEALRLIDLYDAEIRQLDDALARFFASLEELGVANETLLIVTSDHGEEFLDHGDVLHGQTLHTEVVHVPLILVGPGVPRGARFRGQVSPVDLFPTSTALLGLSALDGLEGLDLSSAWRAPSAWPAERALYSETRSWSGSPEGSLRGMIQRGPYALHYDRLSGKQQLFWHEDDPRELTDIAERDPQRVQALWRELEAFLAGAQELEDSPMTEDELKELQALGYR